MTAGENNRVKKVSLRAMLTIASHELTDGLSCV